MEAAPYSRSYDVAVVGAGVIGLACAWRAAEAGLSVVVLERAAPGAGASGVAAGMLAPVTEAEFGEQELLRLNLDGAARWPSFDEELQRRSGRDTGYRESGALVVAADRDDAEELHRLHEFQHSVGLDAEWLTRTECRRLEPALSPQVAGGILAPQDHHVDPRAVVGALGVALEREGVDVIGGTEVRAIESTDGSVRGVETAAGLVRAGQVVAATGCWTLAIAGTDAEPPPVRPVKGQIIRLRSRSASALASRVVRTPRCYVVARADGEVVVGATVEERGFDTAVTADGVYRLLEAAYEVLPDVGELELVETAASLRPGTPDNAPVIGRGSLEGVVWATGHYRNGVLLAPLTADAVTTALTRGETAPAGARFAPGRFEARRSSAPAQTTMAVTS